MGSSLAKMAARRPIHRSPRAAWLVRLVVCASRNSGRPVGPLLVRALYLPYCPARVARFAVTQPSSWAAAIQSELQQIGVPDPSSCGIAPNAPRTVMHRWLHAAKTLICSHAFAHFQAVGQGTDSLLQYLYWQPTPQLHPIVYGRQTCPSQARSWGLARCGHHDFSDGRSARHRHADPSAPCRFCAVGIDSLEHALLYCSAHQVARQRWMQQSGSSAPLSLHRLFSTNPCINSARDISRNIAYVAHVCQAAAACEC